MRSGKKILIGSCSAKNAQRISLQLEEYADITVAESWQDFLAEASGHIYHVQITDLNMIDCFPTVVLDNLQEERDTQPTIVLLENLDAYQIYRERANLLIEILPFEAISDDRFLSMIDAINLRKELLEKFL